MLDQRVQPRLDAGVVPGLPGRDRVDVVRAGEDARALGGPAPGEPAVVEVPVREQHGAHVAGREPARRQQRADLPPRPALEVRVALGVLSARYFRPGVDEQHAAPGERQRVGRVVAEGEGERVSHAGSQTSAYTSSSQRRTRSRATVVARRLAASRPW